MKIQIRNTHGNILGYFICTHGEWILELELQTTLIELGEIHNHSKNLPTPTPVIDNNNLICLKANNRNKTINIKIPVDGIKTITQMEDYTRIIYATKNGQLIERQVQDFAVNIKELLHEA